MRNLTSRKHPGTFIDIITKINQTITGWINYYGIGRMKTFISQTQQWLNHRLRQMILKRWKKPRTRYQMLRKFGIDHDDAMKLANSRKGYWRLSCSEILHQAITKERLTKWGLKDMSQLYESRYLRD
ncbi:group II intron maturase-specific domain-containing protein [Lederbergia citrisecunda]|uniref:group II intron maturase-specific domain-containing protein n=1 Tax=Lederbergia citrisecunda TaxID=2833583 RepID=UPI003D28973C